MVDLVAITLHPVLQSLAFRLTASLSASLDKFRPANAPPSKLLKYRFTEHFHAVEPLSPTKSKPILAS